ncbi:GP179 protein, partial [Rhinopomastus cyanomelas]|nr:GP179 protein [Rhinopomastus cyanomelas]
KSTSKKSQSEESVKAEVCPWDAPEAEATAKAEICPWEVAAPPSTQKKPRQDKDSLSLVSKSSKEPGDRKSGREEKSIRDRESICPWETTGTEDTPAKPPSKSPALPKSSSKKSQSEESVKAEVCPWEVPEAEATAKADICSWEVAAAPPEKGPSPAKLGLPLEKASVPQPPEES